MEQLEQATVAQLKKLCFMSGLPSSGCKSDIINSLRSGLYSDSKASPFGRIPNNGRALNILSIDMGIRNFSLTRLQLDKTLPFNRPPLVKNWVKFDINAWGKLNNVDGFDPIAYAPVCDRLVSEVLFRDDEIMPDVVLIERQRARTMGSSNVIEWVFRVNMFESLLHGFVYGKVKSREGVTDVFGSSPQRMGSYWKLADEDGGKKTDPKKFRIRLVESWLRHLMTGKPNEQKFLLDPERFPFDDELISNISKIRSKSKWINQIILGQSEFIDSIYKDGDADKGSAIQKGDDLVDSMLHGLAFYEWERNKMILKLELNDSLEAAIGLSEKLYESHMRRLKAVE